MAAGFPTASRRSIASQTPMSIRMSCCAAISASTCTRTREGMSSIVQRDAWCLCNAELDRKMAPVGRFCGRLSAFGKGHRPRRHPADSGLRHSGRAGYVIGGDQGRLGQADVLSTEGAPVSTVRRAPFARHSSPHVRLTQPTPAPQRCCPTARQLVGGPGWRFAAPYAQRSNAHVL